MRPRGMSSAPLVQMSPANGNHGRVLRKNTMSVGTHELVVASCVAGQHGDGGSTDREVKLGDALPARAGDTTVPAPPAQARDTPAGPDACAHVNLLAQGRMRTRQHGAHATTPACTPRAPRKPLPALKLSATARISKPMDAPDGYTHRLRKRLLAARLPPPPDADRCRPAAQSCGGGLEKGWPPRNELIATSAHYPQANADRYSRLPQIDLGAVRRLSDPTGSDPGVEF